MENSMKWSAQQITEAENQLQAKCFQWHWNRYTDERQCLFHVNNKSKNAIEGNTMKAMGVVRGISDLVLVSYCGRTLYLECKWERGTQFDEQESFQKQVEARGHVYRIFRSFEEFVKIVEDEYRQYKPVLET